MDTFANFRNYWIGDFEDKMMVASQCIPEWLETSLKQPIAILGQGRSGLAAASLIRKHRGETQIFDENGDDGSESEFNGEIARAYSLIVCSPSFGSSHPWVVAAREAGCRLVPEFDLGAALWRGPVVAITGTNGKTTLTSFLNEAFQQAGIESYAVGNIGSPLCEVLSGKCNPEAIAVCEISSFQAEQMSEFQADHVLWTNFDEDHLDRHESMQSYFRSKYNLVSIARGETVLVGRSVYEYGKQIGVDFQESCVVEDEQNVESLGIAGSEFETVPERRTYLMARALWLALRLPEADLVRAAFAFRKSPHRIELIGSLDGVRFWNDSKATNFHAVYGALERFEEPVFWIGGGKDKGGDLEAFTRRIAPKIKAAVVIGETKERLSDAFENEACVVSVQPTMEAAVRSIAEIAKTGDNVLLSPGFASFDMFKSYSERGETFRKLVDCLQSKRSMKDD